MKWILLFFLMSKALLAQATGEIIVKITVKGNGKVESDAIVTMLKSQKGEALREELVQEDIRTLYGLGYFSEISFYKDRVDGGVVLIVEVKEKASIASIAYEGMNEVTEDDLKEKLEVKQYSIVNEAAILRDAAIITKMYADKGFYLATVGYKLNPKGENEVDLVFVVEEGGLVQVGDVDILGNRYFTDQDLTSKCALRPLSRMTSLSSPPSIYQDDFLKRDMEFLAYYYKDQGFQEVQIAKPITKLDSDRKFVRVTFALEEGLQYRIGKIDIKGDLLYPKEELMEAMKLKPKELFRYSFFQKDVEMLTDKYGDLGYAFADVNPQVSFNRDSQPPTADIVYEITKGDKVYFGAFTVVGNTKTRDNVVRREFEVADSELYSGTRLTQSKRNVERLGFFEEVQAIRSRDEEDPGILNYRLKVKEKPTGQLQAAIGFQPGQSAKQQSWFGQGRYSEENQSGYGWQTNVTGKWNGESNYELSTGFNNPHLDDSPWSLGVNTFFKNTVRELTSDIEIQEQRLGGSLTLGRDIIELIRGSITYGYTKIKTESDQYVLNRLREDGTKSTLTFALSRRSTNDNLDPSEGTTLRLAHSYSGGPLGGSFEFMESTAEASAYLPIDFTDTYRTYFHLHGVLGYLQTVGDEPLPLIERYRLGGYNDLRGYDTSDIGPKYNLMQNPQGDPSTFNKGGDKQMYYQLEYFVPLIPEANVKALVFGDAGRVFDDDESLSFKNMKYDYGFGFRWITPIAPFRFEWAFPVEDGKAGDMKFIFYLGY